MFRKVNIPIYKIPLSFTEETSVNECNHGDNVPDSNQHLHDDHDAPPRWPDHNERPDGNKSTDHLDEIDRSFTIDP